MKYIKKYVKRLILAGFLLYTYNLIAVTFFVTIPINFYTILVVGFLDFPGLIALVSLRLIGL